MSKFKKKRGGSNPAISTASLPDIIFMLLFFFMVVTVMKNADLKVDVKVPLATQLNKLESKSLVSYIYIGKPKAQFESLYGSAPRLQLNDKVADVSSIPLFLEMEKQSVPEQLQPAMTISLRADEGVTMGIVSDVKVELRKQNMLKVNYSAHQRTQDL